MKKIINKYTNSNVKNITMLSVVFVLLFLLSSNLFYKTYKDNLAKRSNNNFDLNIAYLNTYFQKNLLVERENTLSNIDKSIDLNLFKEISINYERFIFDKDSLIEKIPNFSDKSWKVAEVIVDVRSGYIKAIENTSLYEFIPSKSFQQDKAINIRLQLYKDSEIKNFITQLNFSNLKESNFLDGDKFFKLIDSLLTIDLHDRNYEVEIDGQLVAKVSYKLNNYYIKAELQDFLVKLTIFTLIMILPVIFVVGFYHSYIFSTYVNKPIAYLNKYLDNIIGNKYTNIDKNVFEGTPEIIELTKKVSKISSKIASLTNELNMNRESLEIKASTDTLTGLPNKNIFDFDVKNMFISSVNGYVFVIRLDGLAKLSKNHDSGYINNFIEHYTSVIKNVVFNFSKSENKVYRFYGSQFAIVSKNMKYDDAVKLCSEITETLTSKMSQSFEVPDELVQIGGTSLDLYGTIESTLNSAAEAYDKSKELGINKFYVISEEEVAKNYAKLDSNVKEIIEKSKFDISFVLDTYSFDEPDEIVMKEVSPKLVDHNGEKMFIGSFVSVAQKLNIIEEFDKQVIIKAVEHIKESSCKYELAINLSFMSLEKESFSLWLEEYFKENEKYLSKIVFSITAYSAYLHKLDFIRFVKRVDKIGLKTILKRYKADDYPLEQLENLPISYIRMHKDYTTGFSNDAVKKHRVKNILIFGQLHNINIIADTVKLDLDYNLLDRLGTYATSK